MNIKKLTIWTIILNFFIIIGAGHGIGFLGLIEVGGLTNKYGIGGGHFSLSLNSDYENSIFPSALLALIGQLFLLFSFFKMDYKKQFFIQIIGLFFLWLSFFYLVHNLFSDNLAQISFLFGIPFLIFSGILFYRIQKQK